MTRYAQTNLQLFNQLQAAGYAASDLALLKRAYALAIELFPACFRPSGKPFLAHAVGTASILADLGAPAATVTAGLLHAAYSLGDFGDGRRGPTDAKRRRLCEIVGERVEDLVFRYQRGGWRPNRVRDLRKRLGELEAIEREVVFMRLANELEDHLDLAGLYVADTQRLRERLAPTLELAADFGVPRLTQHFEECIRNEQAANLPAELQGERDRSFVAAPLSYRLRLRVRVARFFSQRSRRRAQALRRAPGASSTSGPLGP